MDLIIFLAVGGGGILLFLVVFVMGTRSLLANDMDRKIRSFKQQLTVETEDALEQFRKGVMTQLAKQEERAKTLADIYSMLVQIGSTGREFAALSRGEGDITVRLQKAAELGVRIQEFFTLYQKHSIYFTDKLTVYMDKFAREFEPHLALLCSALEKKPGNSRAEEKLRKDLRAAWNRFEEQVLTLQGELKSEFRRSSGTAIITDLWSSVIPPMEASDEYAKHKASGG